MQITLNLQTLLLGIASCNFVMTMVLLLLDSDKRKKLSNYLLAILLFNMAFTCVCSVLHFNGNMSEFCALQEIEFTNLLLISPFLFLYVLSLTRPSFSLKWQFLWLFLPVFVYILLYFSINTNQYFLNNLHQTTRFFVQFQLLVGISACFWLIRKHNFVIRELMSSIENENLLWLRNFMFASLSLFLTWILTDFFGLPHIFYAFLIVVLTYWFGYKVMKQKEIFAKLSSKVVLETIENVNETSQIRYRNSSLTDLAKADLIKKIEKFMQNAKPYRNNELTLPMLAEQLEISTNNLSQVLNEGFGENFYKFINRYRIEESQLLLLDSSLNHFSILGIAFEAGFNSKATFNKTFKEIVGISPSEFIKNKQNEEILQK